MSDSIKFTYDNETDTLLVQDGDIFDSFKFKVPQHQSDRILRCIVKSIADLTKEPPGFYVKMIPRTLTGFVNPNDYISDGEFIKLVEDQVYTVVCDGIPYENQVVKKIEIPGHEGSYFLGLGNLDTMFIRSTYAAILPEEERVKLVESDIPFVIVQAVQGGQEIDGASFVFLGNSTDHTLVVTRVSDSTSYTVSITGMYVSKDQDYCPPMTLASLTELLNIYDGGELKVILNGEEETHGTWTYFQDDDYYMFLLDGYTPENYDEAPISIGIEGGILFFLREDENIPRTGIEAVFIRE